MQNYHLPHLLKLNNAFKVFVIFLFVYFILPLFFGDYIKNLNMFLYLSVSLVFPPLIILGSIKLFCGTIYLRWQNFKKLPYLKLYKKITIAILVAFLANILWSLFLTLSEYDLKEPAINQLIKNATPNLLIVIGISAIIIAPIVEEITFRQVIYDGFLGNKISKEMAIILTSLLFALVHLELMPLCGLFILGFYFQRIKNEFDSLESAIIAHATNNALSFILLLILRNFSDITF